MSDKKCLLIIPNKFYSFHKLIEAGLVAKGYTVTIANDEYPINAFGKITGKLQLPIVFSSTYNYFKKHILDGERYSLTVIVKGRGMSNKLITALKSQSDRVVGYNWDSFKYNKGPLKWYKNVDKYYTFDFEDSLNYSIPILELFSSLQPDKEPKVIKYDFSALFRNHSKRLKYLDNVLSSIKESSAFIYIYEQNVLTFTTNFLKNPSLYLKYKKHIHFKPLPYTKYLEALKSSAFTIDYAHPDQSGITMRCYESLSMNTRIITNNLSVKKSNYFNDANSIVFPLNGDVGKLVREYNECKDKNLKAKYRRIGNFVDELTTI